MHLFTKAILAIKISKSSIIFPPCLNFDLNCPKALAEASLSENTVKFFLKASILSTFSLIFLELYAPK
jgi:hypothetical protein